MVSFSILNVLSSFGLVGLGLCQQQQYTHLKNQPADPRSHLVSPPKFGFGTWYLNLSIENTTEAVAGAIVQGYRHIDAAAVYENQQGVGLGIKEGLKRANITRSDIWITTKLWGDMILIRKNTRHQDVEKGINTTLKDLGLDYIDLYLLHFPFGERAQGKCYDLCSRPPGSTLKPLVHQMEVHPYLQQREWVKKNKDLNLTIIAYAPLGNTSPTYHKEFYNNKEVWGDLPMLLENETIKKIAAQRKCTPVQVVLSWNLRLGQVVIPKSARLDHQKENWGALNCKLTDEDDKEIAGIEAKHGPRRMLKVCGIYGINCYEGLSGMERWKGWKSPLGL
ncbi:Aldo/keto reductase [Tothia fuscella]|uniref:Aldo/keto reductase n=1 Tax=Tothia fuscella TaxID=1048955 RepID=A0A9P4P5A9_9PEZI|nr:Aldo/keto reductase [Tothia fuscella]